MNQRKNCGDCDKAKQAALDWAADAIKAQDGGNMETETGWASDEALAHWLTIRRMADSC